MERLTTSSSSPARGPTAAARGRRRGSLLAPLATGLAVGVQVLAAGQMLRRMALPAVGPVEAPPIPTDPPARPSGAAPSIGGHNVTFAHELRRRLAALRVLSEAIEVGTSSEEDLERLVHLLVREMHDLEQLERVMLGGNTARVETLEEVDLLAVAKAAAQTVGWARGSEVRVQGSRRPLRVRTDPTMLRQALENLIDNAATCGAGQPVDVVTRMSMARRAPGVEVLVADRGPGLGRASTARRSSHGVGLPLVRRYVQESGGRLWSHNREGGGAVFGLWLPIGNGEANGNGANPAANPAAANGNGRRANGHEGKGGGGHDA